MADGVILIDEILYLPAGVYDCAVIAPAKCLADLGQAVTRQLLCKRHGYLPRTRN